ncbi:MAG: prolipoprotein diacylglyceryl transferase [Deltaproteobacteria bacterium]|nr:prolipoprotein diacylglyceryl transferase [Deltaproteobacteria bacterium]
MWPEVFFIGPIGLNAYGLLVALGVFLALGSLKRSAKFIGWPPRKALDLAFWLIIAGLIGARLFYVIFNWPMFKGQPLTILAYWRGGLMFQGALFLATLTAFILIRRQKLSFGAFSDAVAPALALGQSVGRLGCYAAGCCYGRPAPDFPLAVIFPPGSPAPFGFPLYPTQLLESLGLFTLFWGLFAYLKRGPARGRVFGLYLVGAGSLRAMMETLRGDFRGEKIWGQAPTFYLALTAILAGLLVLSWPRKSLRPPSFAPDN